MTGDAGFRYVKRGRTLLTTALFATSGAIFLYGLAFSMPAPLLAVLGVVIVGLGYLVVQNPTSGIALGANEIKLWCYGRREVIPFERILRVHLDSWSLTVDATVHLSDGSTVEIPTACLPPEKELVQALTTAGIAVTDS